jgi:hypothetical protein
VPTFYVDPWHGVDTAVITHAHADHARYTDKPVYLHGVAGKGPYGVDDGDGTLLSAVQWRWLEELPTRPAGLRIVASSIQVLASHHGYESWANFPHERERLLSLVSQARACA